MSFLFRKKIWVLFLLIIPCFFIQSNVANAVGSAGVNWNYSTNIDQPSSTQDPQSQLSEKEEERGWWKGILDGIGSLFVATTFAVPLIALLILGFVAMVQTSILTGISVFSFDSAIEKGIYYISDIVNNTEIIKSSWLIFRNLGNIGLIFALVFIAIQVILRSNGYDAKKLLGRVVIAGVLMNFSFFFAALVVDVSNELSILVYDEIGKTTGESLGSPNIGSFIFAKYGHAAISAAFSQKVDGNQKKIFDETMKSIQGAQKQVTSGGANGLTNFMTSLTMLTLGLWIGAGVNLLVAIIFFTVTGLVIGRLVAILLLLVISPIGFVGMVLPSTEKMARDWRESLIGHCFFLPAFLLFLLVAVKIIDQLPQNSQQQANLAEHSFDFSALISQITPQIINFLLISGLLIAAIKMAQSLSSRGSAAVGKISASISSGVSGAISGSTMGGMALLGRNTLGAGAEVLSKSQGMTNFAKSHPIIGGNIMKQLEGVAKSSMDIRGTKAFKGVASATGVGDMSKYFKSPKDGFRGQTNSLAKTFESTYKAVPDADKKDVESEKAEVEKTKSEVTTQEAVVKDLKKQVASGKLSAGHSKVTDAEKALKDAKDAQKKAAEDYAKAKNPAKYEFIEKANAPSSNPIVNVWIKPAQKKAAESLEKILKEKEGKDEKYHKELVKGLEEIKKANKSE